MKIGCWEVPKPTYPSLLWPAEWKAPAPLKPLTILSLMIPACEMKHPWTEREWNESIPTIRESGMNKRMVPKIQKWEVNKKKFPKSEKGKGMKKSFPTIREPWLWHNVMFFVTLTDDKICTIIPCDFCWFYFLWFLIKVGFYKCCNLSPVSSM